jgi:hypothetical protein
MKRIFFLTVVTIIIYFGCTKINVQPTSILTITKTLVANAGLNSTICMPYNGSGNVNIC